MNNNMPKRTNNKTPQTKKRAERSIFGRARDQLVAAARNRYTGKSAVKNIASDVAMLKTILNTENKHIDTLSTPITLGVGGSVSWVASPAEGDDSNNRNGRSIKVDRIDLVLYATWNPGTAPSLDDQWIRWFVVRYLKTPSTAGSTPFSLAEFLQADPNGNRTVFALSNTDTAENFQIMDQGLFKIPVYYATSATGQTSSQIIESSIPCSFHQTFNGTAATNVCDNSVFFVAVCLNSFATGGQCNILPQFRLWYVDN